ncbi:MAG: hypothetical protein LBC73_10970 [Oscillospiraceae bacterium]|nr:hypothetical protein [Oscillospiraceae bacterium]
MSDSKCKTILNKRYIVYDALFKYRYIVAILVFILLVVNKIHFSSIGVFNDLIQPNITTDNMSPLFGMLRNPRTSDEWLVVTPSFLSAQFGASPYGEINEILRGGATENMPFFIYISIATLAYPFNFFFILGVEYGLSARWVGTLFTTIMVAFEFIYIITKGNRTVAVIGASVIALSPFVQWWAYVPFITAGLGSIVCFYYFISTKSKIKKLLLSLGITVFFSQFILPVYPAWQVPAGYLYLGLLIWIIIENRNKIKQLKIVDWGILSLSVVLIIVIVTAYIKGSADYISTMSNTVYPAARLETGGGITLSQFINRAMNGAVFAPMSYFRTVIYEAHLNITEFGGFYTLFPLPVILSIFYMIRKKKVDSLSLILIIISGILGSYIYLGWPEWLSKITLMAYSMSRRVLDIFIFIQVIMFLYALSGFANDEKVKNNSGCTFSIKTLQLAIIVAAFFTFSALFFNEKTFTVPISTIFFFIQFVGFIVVLYSMFDLKKNKYIFKTAAAYLVCLSLATWLTINPVMKGLDVIYEKPLSIKIQELANDTDEKWISLMFEGQGFLVASGASTINSTNFYPNLELWHRLDPERMYEDIYNRYAHVIAFITTEPTRFEYYSHDHIGLVLSIDDFEIVGLKYIHTPYPLDDYGGKLELIYAEDGAFIYMVCYNN